MYPELLHTFKPKYTLVFSTHELHLNQYYTQSVNVWQNCLSYDISEPLYDTTCTFSWFITKKKVLWNSVTNYNGLGDRAISYIWINLFPKIPCWSGVEKRECTFCRYRPLWPSSFVPQVQKLVQENQTIRQTSPPEGATSATELLAEVAAHARRHDARPQSMFEPRDQQKHKFHKVCSSGLAHKNLVWIKHYLLKKLDSFYTKDLRDSEGGVHQIVLTGREAMFCYTL